jgi:DnaJ-class molecular chaperone
MEQEIDIEEALEILELPRFITKEEIKKRYKELVKKHHPDITKDSYKINQIIAAYRVLMDYIDNFRYSFDEDEISKQIPNMTHNQKFRF